VGVARYKKEEEGRDENTAAKGGRMGGQERERSKQERVGRVGERRVRGCQGSMQRRDREDRT